MKPIDDKLLSKGISGDMSPEAIARRLEILAELYDLAKCLRKARFADKVEPEEREVSRSPPPVQARMSEPPPNL